MPECVFALVLLNATIAATLARAASRLAPGLKAAQRALFILLYQLLIGKDTGPRLPTLLLALGQDQIRHLLTPG